HTRFSRDWSSDVCSSDLRLGQTHDFTGTAPQHTVKVVHGHLAIHHQNGVFLQQFAELLVFLGKQGDFQTTTAVIQSNKGNVVTKIGRASCRESVDHHRRC